MRGHRAMIGGNGGLRRNPMLRELTKSAVLVRLCAAEISRNHVQIIQDLKHIFTCARRFFNNSCSYSTTALYGCC